MNSIARSKALAFALVLFAGFAFAVADDLPELAAEGVFRALLDRGEVRADFNWKALEPLPGWTDVKVGARLAADRERIGPLKDAFVRSGGCSAGKAVAVLFAVRGADRYASFPKSDVVGLIDQLLCAPPRPWNAWEDPAVNSENRLPARNFTAPAAKWMKSLNGIWKYRWCGSPDQCAKGFQSPDFDDSHWGTIDVPSCVEYRGHGVAHYTNVLYPHEKNPPFIFNRLTLQHDFNPVSDYRTTFTVPAEWSGRRVILRFEGVSSACTVWVNGRKVGYSEDSMLPAEFDITECLEDFRRVTGDGKSANVLAVRVLKWCDGSYYENQDMFRLSGIFRNVSLVAEAKDAPWDVRIEATLSDDLSRGVITARDENGKALLRREVENPRLWSAEDPYLYEVEVAGRTYRTGFRKIEIRGHVLYYNGKAIKFKGVNRHETTYDNGRTVSREIMLKDVLMMKRHNIDTVRLSHYPQAPYFYDLCDEYGLYVMAEANVESHEFGYGRECPARDPMWRDTVVERNVRNVMTYRNHPSIVFWSLGNEAGAGEAFEDAYAEVKRLDPTRPIHYESACNASAYPSPRKRPVMDVDSTMYPDQRWVYDRGAWSDGKRTVPPLWRGRVLYHDKSRPAFVCEYDHAMGNALGGFQEFWDAFYSSDTMMGGCIWDWVDQVILKDGTWCYGGDFDQQPNDGPFCVNGITDPLRRETPKLIEVAHVHRNLVVTRKADGAFELWNRYAFTPTDRFTGRWELLEDGVIVDRGELELPRLEPGERGKLRGPRSVAAADGKERFLNFEFALKESCKWAEKGFVVARDQVKCGNMEAGECGTGKTGKCGSVVGQFDEKTGSLVSLKVGGREILKKGPRLTCVRAFIDNDRRKYAKDAFNAGLTHLTYELEEFSERTCADGVRTVSIVRRVLGTRACGFLHREDWVFRPGEGAEVTNEVTPFGDVPELARLGLSWALDTELDEVGYYGRGPWENYADRKSGSFLGVWTNTVDGLSQFYVRPQDNGYRSDVRWFELRDRAGKGVRFSADRPLFVQTLRQTWEDLYFARHQAGEARRNVPPPQRDEIYLNLDIGQSGLGDMSYHPLDPYRYFPRPEKFILRIGSLSSD